MRGFFGARTWLAVLLLLFTMAGGSQAQRSAAETPALKAARSFRAANEAKILRFFAHLLSMPNFGGNLDDITRNAEFIAAEFEQRGASMELLRLPDTPPLIYGEIRVPGAQRTIGIYVHYDGQPPAGPDWVHGPYEPVLYTGVMGAGGEARALPRDGESVDPDWRIYARSASDDKAPIPALLSALDALRQADIPLTSNVKFLFEGEEEMGSTHLGQYIETFRDKLDVDVWLFFDGPIHQSGRPQIVFGVRGVTGLDLTVYGAVRPLHSGHYGNWAPVPGQMLASLLASMKDEQGNVTIDGFYDTVEPLGRQELDALSRLPAYDAQIAAELGLAWTEGGGATLAERLLLPSLTIKGLLSGSVGAQARNVIPDRAEAALGVRLVKGNDPQAMLDLVEAHIRDQGFHIVRQDPDLETRARHRILVKVLRGEGYPAARTDMGLPIAESIIEAVQVAAGGDALMVPALGGSLPLYLFTENLGAPALILPIANHDNNQHAANENLRIGNLWYGIDLYASLLTMRAPNAPVAGQEPPSVLRVATFNIKELSRAKIEQVDETGVGANPQLRAAAAIIQRVRPDILVLNEIDHDYGAIQEGLDFSARRFARLYLATGNDPIEYPYSWAAPNNTGILSGIDLNGDGHAATEADRGERSHGDDAFGYGVYPGQYSMAVLSRYPIAGDQARTFRKFRWVDLPGNHIPQGFYSDQALEIFRLSSKSHQDLPVQVGAQRLHLFLSHPTPTVFDRDEDHNGRRNFDEIKLWVHYIDGDETLVDDAGRGGGYDAGDPFVILGDLNARPDADESLYDGRTAISQLLEHPRIRDTGEVAVSRGAPDGKPRATTAFRGIGARIDYVLPSIDLEVLDGGVFWPAAEEDPLGRELAEAASDHRLVWIDLHLPSPSADLFPFLDRARPVLLE